MRFTLADLKFATLAALLLNQVIRREAPDGLIKASPDFKPDKTSTSGITRRMRLQHILEQKKGKASDEDLMILEQACDLSLSLYNKLSGIAHGPVEQARRELKDLLMATELALRQILIP